MTGVEDLNLNIEAIFVQYYNKSLKEQSKGFKNPKSIEIRCCNKKSLINNMARNFGHENRACAYFTANMAAKHSKSLYDINKTK